MRYILFIFLVILYSTNCISQNISIDSLEGERQVLTYHVKQLDQFIKRFNNKEYVADGIEKTKTQLLFEKKYLREFQSERKKELVALLNFEDSAIFNSETKKFINYVSIDSNQIQIDYKDNDWFAKVNCSVRYRGKKQIIYLTLEKEGDRYEGYKWTLAGVNAPFINLQSIDLDTTLFIGPMNHELGFMGLYNVFNDPLNISEYAYSDYTPDHLSVFFFLVKSNEIQYDKVNSIQYHFLQISNWIFTVDYFDRPQSNSGWLISSVLDVPESEKISYRKEILYLRK